jgi:hypothetical protein
VLVIVNKQEMKFKGISSRTSLCALASCALSYNESGVSILRSQICVFIILKWNVVMNLFLCLTVTVYY